MTKASEAVSALMKQLGADLAIARKRRGISLTEMAARTGVTRTTYRKLETGASGTWELFLVTLWILGMSDRLVTILTPEADDRALRQEIAALPTRPRRKSRKDLIDPKRLNF